ncbi:unnamed protein product [Colias eurytheme]|nr:unnamed protein product [Colias eurytheme]
MRLLIFLSALAAASALVEVDLSKDYHINIGIPAATRIKQVEDEAIASGSRIVGGAIAPADAYPYLAGLVIRFHDHMGTSACGSTLVSLNRLVTAAHCWRHSFSASEFTVVLGSQYLFHGGERIVTNHVVLHPQYIPSMLMNDVAIIYLPRSVSVSSSIRPVSLPHNDLWNTFTGEWAMAAGYGKTSDSQSSITTAAQVSHVMLQVISEVLCRASFGSIIQASTLCTSGARSTGICSGDSGGPLVLNRNGEHILIGISSFVANTGCQNSHPSGFARVTSFYNFIMQHM